MCDADLYRNCRILKQVTEVSDQLYTFEELSKAFKASLITYPKIMYCQSKKELYKHLYWHSKKLVYHGKVNLSSLAKAMNMIRKIVAKYV